MADLTAGGAQRHDDNGKWTRCRSVTRSNSRAVVFRLIITLTGTCQKRIVGSVLIVAEGRRGEMHGCSTAADPHLNLKSLVCIVVRSATALRHYSVV